MNLPVIPGQVFHSDSQEVLDRAERSITMRETVQRACHKPPTASRQKYRESQGMQQPAWSRRTGSNPAVGQGQSFRAQGRNPATYSQRKSQSRGGNQQGSSRRYAGRDGPA